MEFACILMEEFMKAIGKMINETIKEELSLLIKLIMRVEF